MKVQLLYFSGCPNLDSARENLRRALQSVGAGTEVEEIDTNDPQTPEELRAWGSPTILVDGIDVAGASSGGGACCRLYGEGGAPTEETILAALRRA